MLMCLWALPAPPGIRASRATRHAIRPLMSRSSTELQCSNARAAATAELLSMPLLAGDRVRTQAGRVEVLFADGSALHLDEHTMVDFQSDEVVRLLGGRVRLSVSGPSREIAYRIDAPSAWVQINNPGEYRVSRPAARDEVELAVLRGGAELVNEQGRSYMSAGERTFAACRRRAVARLRLQFGGVGCVRPLVRVAPRSAARRVRAVSARRRAAVCAGVRHLWQLAPRAGYGYVWYPRVPVGWRPYYHGRWVSLPPVRLDVDRRRSLGMADASLWPVGDFRRRRGSGFPAVLGAGVGVVGLGTRATSAGVRLAGTTGRFSASIGERLRRPPLRPVVRVVGRAVRHFSRGYVNVSRCHAVRVDPRLHGSFVGDQHGPAAGLRREPFGGPHPDRWPVVGLCAATASGAGDSGGPRAVAGGAVTIRGGRARFPARRSVRTGSAASTTAPRGARRNGSLDAGAGARSPRGPTIA